MLVNVESPTRADAEFNAYLDTAETRLFKKLWPILTAAVQIQVATSGERAENYVVSRGGPVLVAHIERIFREQFVSVSEDLARKAFSPYGHLLNDFMAEMSSQIERYGAARVRNIAESLRDRIREITLAKVREGKPNQVIAKEIRREAPQITKPRAATIARTETHNAALAGIEGTLKYKRIKVTRKQWWTALDDRVRPTHADVHGVVLPMEEKFEVGDDRMDRPGDPSGSAEEVINCRCSLLFLTETGDEGLPRLRGEFEPGVKARGKVEGDALKAAWVKESPIQTLVDARNAAPTLQRALGQVGKEVSRSHGIEFKNPGVKTRTEKGVARSTVKLEERNGVAAAVTDIARGAFVVDTPAQAEAAIRALAERFEVLVEDWRRTPVFYGDKAILVRDKSGLIGEVQIIERKMYEAKQGKGHALYEEWRDKATSEARKEELAELQKKLYGAIFDAYPAEWKEAFGVTSAAVVPEATTAVTLSEEAFATRLESMATETKAISFRSQHRAPTADERKELFALTRGMDPERFLKRMAYTPSEETPVSIMAIGGEVSMSGRSTFATEDGFRLSRSFTAEGKSYTTASHDLFTMLGSVQGKGVGKKVLASQLELYDDLGIALVDIHANIDVGGYAWAKYGFVPDRNSWAKLKTQLKRKGDAALLKILRQGGDDPKTIWAIADMPDGAGKKWLLNSDWHGTLNLKSPAVRERVKKYVGKE